MANRNKHFLKYYPLFAMLVIAAQLAANVLGPRTIVVGPFLLPGGIWCFPLTFFLWDIITEVYGFERARQLIFYYIIVQLFFALMINFSISMQAASTVLHPIYYADVLGHVFRITISMIIAVVLGDYVNCYILDKMKHYAHGKYLWMRLIGATAVGELATSMVWVLFFYTNTVHHPSMLKLIFSQYTIKILFEIVFVPPTYIIVWFLNKNEKIDPDRRYVNFDPYSLEKL